MKLALRLLLGVVVLAAGAGKALDVPGFLDVIRTYEIPWMANPVLAWAVVIFELGLGAWLLAGRRLEIAAALSVAMHAGYFVLLSSALLRGLDLNNCGCFGVFLARPLRWYSPIEDLVLIGISLLLIVPDRKKEPT